MIARLRYITLIVIAIFFVQNVSAQSSGLFQLEDKNFYGGVVLGANMCTVDGDGYGGYHKVGFNAGGVVYVKFVKNFLGSIELLYTQKGSRGVNATEYSNLGPGFEKYYLDLNYVEVPLVLHYALTTKWHLGAGGAYGRLINSKEDAYAAVPIYLKEEDHPFKKEDLSFILHLGFQFGNGIFITGRYQRSIATVRDPLYVPIGFGGGNQYNSIFSFRLMYLIP